MSRLRKSPRFAFTVTKEKSTMIVRSRPLARNDSTNRPSRAFRASSRRRVAALIATALCSIAVVVPASASAFVEPGITGNSADFANCPVNVLTAGREYGGGACLHSYTTGGVVQIGHSSVPISVPGDTFDAAVTQEGEPEAVCSQLGLTECAVSGAHGILGGPAQPVPGGLLGTIGNTRITGVRAKVEWAAPASPDSAFGTVGCSTPDPLVTVDVCKLNTGEPGTATTLSLKVHLLSSFLGPDCYIGSAAEPIVIPLTTGTTDPPLPATPIHGKPYEFIKYRAGSLQLLGVVLVNNSFSVPPAHGCGTSGTGLVDSAINHKLGLPSPAGQNKIVVEADGEDLGPFEILATGGWTGENGSPEEEEAGEEEGATETATAGPASLPDNRALELVSPVQKNGETPYAAVPSTNGEAVDFQARGALPGAGSGGLNLYRATRGSSGWQTESLTPTPSKPLGALELQAPLWTSGDLTQTIFTTPSSYSPADEDNGALSLYGSGGAGQTLLSQGTQGGSEEKSATFDAASPDGQHVVFSSGASLLPSATGLEPQTAPEAQYLYQRDVGSGETNLLSLDSSGQPAGYAATTLPEGYEPGPGVLKVADLEGFLPGQAITVGSGPSAETTKISSILFEEGTPVLEVNTGHSLPTAYPPGTPVAHLAEGAILGDGSNLGSSAPPAGEYLPANTGSGSTTNAVSADGSKAFFEAPNPATGQPVGLYMRHGNSTVKIAGARQYGTVAAGLFVQELGVSGFARYQGAAADGSLVFFSSDEGLAGATPGRELYEFNTTEHAIGGVATLTVRPVSAGLGGDSSPATTLVSPAQNTSGASQTITVASTAGFHPGDEILFAPYELTRHRRISAETGTIASVDGATDEITLIAGLVGAGGKGIPPGTELHAVHPAHATAISNDGSHVYFVSEGGVLAENENSQGASASPTGPNLYLYDTQTNETTFIAILAKKDVEDSKDHPSGLAARLDVSRPAVPTPDGKVLAFASAANLTGQNPWQRHTEIYRYSVAGETLQCLSCTEPGVPPTGDASFGETAGGTYAPPSLTSPMSEDGSMVFFDTPDSLVAEDQNSAAPPSPKFEDPTSTDVYQWTTAGLSLISSGTATTPAVLQGTDPSGRDVLFTSTQAVPGSPDGGYENVIDARLGGGFPSAEEAATPTCAGAGCREAFGPAPLFGPPATLNSSGETPAITQPKANKKYPKKHKKHVRHERNKGKQHHHRAKRGSVHP